MMLGKLRNLIHPKPVKDAIPLILLKLEYALVNLKDIGESLRSEDNELFEKCIEARVRRDYTHAMMYANECVEIRKLAKLIVSSQYALEQMMLRLQTVKKLSNILVTMSPVVGVLKEMRSRLVGIVPSVANNLNEVNQILVGNLREMGTTTTQYAEPITCGEDAKKILDEANLAAEQSIRERFPNIPEDIKFTVRERNPIVLEESA
jgi:division protein CdvB (Snf7/Vps24/ESCRT-III family)